MFSKPSLKASLNLVSNCIPLGLFQRKSLFSEGLVNFKMLKSNWLYFIAVEGKIGFLK